MNSLRFYKNVGHKLMENYITLLPPNNPAHYRTRIYHYLRKNLREFSSTGHFSDMNNMEEILRANALIKKLIKRRKNELEKQRNNIIAPNILEIQKQANELNKGMLMA